MFPEIIFAWGGGAPVEPASTVGLLTNFGMAGAALVMAYFFLQFIREEGKRRDAQMADENKRRDDQEQKRDDRYYEFIAQQGRVIQDNTAAMREFRAGVHQICQAPGVVRHDRRNPRSAE